MDLLAAPSISTPMISPHELRADRRAVWLVKPSTHCNLRCRYCYEWDHLANRHRIALTDWPRIFSAVKGHQEILGARLRHAVWSHVILQGGEPLLLPLDYLQSVAGMHLEILGQGDLLSVQSNLTVLSDEVLSFLARGGITMGVSWDGVPNARLDLGGQPTHMRVLANMRLLADAGVPFGVNLVLGMHNHRSLIGIYNQLLDLGAAWLSVIPMFRSTTPDTIRLYQLPPASAAMALARLYEHWVSRGRRLHVQPLDRCERIVQGSPQPPGAEPRFVVRPDLRVSLEGGTSEPGIILGDLKLDRMKHILASTGYRRAASSLGQVQPCEVESRLYELIRTTARRAGAFPRQPLKNRTGSTIRRPREARRS